MMHLLSLQSFFLFLSLFVLTTVADDAEAALRICGDLKNPWWKMAHDLDWCDVEEPTKHHGKGPQCRPGITTCKDREHRCCNDSVCELMCDPDEEDDDHEEGHPCGGEGDKECSCRHTCGTEGEWAGKCQQKPSFANGKDEDGVCIMVAAKHNNNGTSKAGISATGAKHLNTTLIHGFNGTNTSVEIPRKSNTTTILKPSQKHGAKKNPAPRPVKKSKPNPQSKPATSPIRQSRNLEPENLSSKYQQCSGGRMRWPDCKSTETCLDIARFQDEKACGGRCDGPSYCIQSVYTILSYKKY
jgi:hypothetical protein